MPKVTFCTTLGGVTPNLHRFDLVCTNRKCEHRFVFEGTKSAFIDNDHRCPECASKAKRALFAAGGVTAGTVVPGLRVEYPYYNWQLPVLPGQKPGEQIVKSRAHERDICAGAWGKSDQRYEINQV